MAKSQWEEIIEKNPAHTQKFIDKFERAVAEGRDIVREARLIDAMVPRQARILDAGCGHGRHVGHLVACGHTVVGVDVDPGLIRRAEETIDGATFVCANLDRFELPPTAPNEFDAILLAGNVVTFFHPDTRILILKRLRNLLAVAGRMVVGFGGGRGYRFGDFRADAAAAGLELQNQFSTWEMRPFFPDSDFLVSVWGTKRVPGLDLAGGNLSVRPLGLVKGRPTGGQF